MFFDIKCSYLNDEIDQFVEEEVNYNDGIEKLVINLKNQSTSNYYENPKIYGVIGYKNETWYISTSKFEINMIEYIKKYQINYDRL